LLIIQDFVALVVTCINCHRADPYSFPSLLLLPFPSPSSSFSFPFMPRSDPLKFSLGSEAPSQLVHKTIRHILCSGMESTGNELASSFLLVPLMRLGFQNPAPLWIGQNVYVQPVDVCCESITLRCTQVVHRVVHNCVQLVYTSCTRLSLVCAATTLRYRNCRSCRRRPRRCDEKSGSRKKPRKLRFDWSLWMMRAIVICNGIWAHTE